MIVGFIINGQNYSFDDALELSLQGKIEEPFSYLSILAENLRHEHNFPSPSGVFTCPRKVFFEKTRDYYVTPDSQYFLIRGTMIHRTLEMVEREGALKELLVDIDTGDYKLKGTADLYLSKEKQLRDYKTTAKIAVDYHHGGHQIAKYLYKESYFNQLNLYILGLRQSGREVESAFLEYYSMDNSSDLAVAQVPVPIDTDKAVYLTNNALCIIMQQFKNEKPAPFNACLQDHAWMCTKAKCYCDVKQMCWEEK